MFLGSLSVRVIDFLNLGRNSSGFRGFAKIPVLVFFIRDLWTFCCCLFLGFDPPLGMSSKAILDEKISTSSTQSKAFHPSYGRLHLHIGAGGWCALEQNTEQYFEITLADGYPSKYVISAVATQGVLTIKSWVRSYYFSYTLASSLEWTFYHDSNKRKVTHVANFIQYWAQNQM